MDLNNLNIKAFQIDVTPRFNPPNQIMRNFRINALHVSGDLELTEHGRALLQEYIDSIRYESPEHPHCLCYVPVEPRRKRAYCNTRIRMVQAKRKAMDLGQDGKCCGLRTRRASLALRKAESAGKRSEQPCTSDFGHVPARVRRRQAKDAKRFYRMFPLAARLGKYKQWWMDMQEEERIKIDRAIEEAALVTGTSVGQAKAAFVDVWAAYSENGATL